MWRRRFRLRTDFFTASEGNGAFDYEIFSQ